MPDVFFNLDNAQVDAISVGRGSEVSDRIVPLEPEFPSDVVSGGATCIIDDGRVPNRISRFFGSARPESSSVSPVEAIRPRPSRPSSQDADSVFSGKPTDGIQVPGLQFRWVAHREPDQLFRFHCVRDHRQLEFELATFNSLPHGTAE